MNCRNEDITLSSSAITVMMGMLKKVASGVLTLLPCSRTESTLRAPKGLRPCWTNFFEHSLSLVMGGLSGEFMGHEHELFNKPMIISARQGLCGGYFEHFF